MNYYIVVEGKAEKPVYKCWIPLVNQSLSFVNRLDDIHVNNFVIYSAHGYPEILDAIDNAILDINDFQNIDRFIISLDSEELTRQEKYQEINDFIQGKNCSAQIIIVIQHFCLETWALGNRRVVPRNPTDPKLIEYRDFFDVLIDDPELLPPYENENLNRAKFAFKYLKIIFNNRFRTLTYSKRKPTPLLHTTYFNQVRQRLIQTGHISSFADFLNAFV